MWNISNILLDFDIPPVVKVVVIISAADNVVSITRLQTHLVFTNYQFSVLSRDGAACLHLSLFLILSFTTDSRILY